GRYRIIRKLGAGGMANVYLAEDQELGRSVAIKILDDRHAADDSFIERFRREAKNAAGLSHPNIVSIYDRGEAEGTYYIAMEYLDGRSLKELIVSRGPAPIHVAIDYTRQTLNALRFAHRNGIVHRDIKPHNVLVDSAVRAAPRRAARAGHGRPARAREGSGGPLPERRGDGRRARPRLARATRQPGDGGGGDDDPHGRGQPDRGDDDPAPLGRRATAGVRAASGLLRGAAAQPPRALALAARARAARRRGDRGLVRLQPGSG